MVERIPLMSAAAKAKRSYNVLLRLVLRGDVAGWQDERGRWFVDSNSLSAFLAQHEPAQPAA